MGALMKCVFGALIAGTLLQYSTVALESVRRPNIVVVLADDLGIGDVGCFGNDTIRTPNIDFLCKSGAKLTHHVTAAPVCTPSRAALLTGRYPKRIGMVSDESAPHVPDASMVIVWTASTAGLPESEITIGEVAKTAGYRTGFLGKWHLGLNCPGKPNCHSPLNQGFDYWWGIPQTNMKDFGDQGDELKWIGRQRQWTTTVLSIGATLILAAIIGRYVGFIGGISFGILLLLGAFIPLLFYFIMDFKFWNSMIVRNAEVVERPIELDTLSDRFVKEVDSFIGSTSSSPYLLVLSFAHVHTALHALPRHKGKSRHGRYGDAVEEMDWSVGKLVESIQRYSSLDNTLIYFSSDHGGHREGSLSQPEPFGGWNGGYRGGKFVTYEGGIRVPTIVTWPGVVTPGVEVPSLTSNMDVMATIVDVLDIEETQRPKLDGKSLLPLLQPPQPGKRLPSKQAHSILLHHCDFMLNGATYEPDGPTGNIWKVHWRVPKWIPGTDGCDFRCDCFNDHEAIDTPLLYNLALDPYELRPIPVNDAVMTSVVDVSGSNLSGSGGSDMTSRRLVALIEEMAREKDAAMRGSEPQLIFGKIALNPTLMPFCRKWPYLYCRDAAHEETYGQHK